MNHGALGNWSPLMCTSCCPVEAGPIVLSDVTMSWLVRWWPPGDSTSPLITQSCLSTRRSHFSTIVTAHTNRYFIHRQTSQSTRNVRNAPSWPQNYLTSVFTGSIRLINFHLSAACRCRVLDPQQNGKYPSRFLVPIAYFCIFTGW